MQSPVGESVRVVDAVPRVTGSIDFVLNHELPGMAVGRIKRSEYPHARLLSVDASRARALPGVVAVATGRDLSKLALPSVGRFFLDQSVLATDRVRYVGEPIAAVAAMDEATAAEALDLIDVEYEELPAVFTVDDALAESAPLLHDPRPAPHPKTAHMFNNTAPPSNVCSRFAVEEGSVLDALERAEWVVDETYESQPVQHVPLETHVSVASFDGRLTVWSSTQMPHAVRSSLADMFGLPFSGVRVLVTNIGGGFGSKGSLRLEPITSLLALIARRPVKLHLSREEEFVTITRHGSKVRITSGIDADGRLIARKVVAHYNTGAYADVGPMVARNAGSAIAGPYNIPNVAIESSCIWTNLVPAGAFRGFGVVQGAWAYESHMDTIAHRIGADPVEFRNSHFLRSGDRYVTGETMNDMHFRELLSDVVKAVEDAPDQEPEQVPATTRRGKGYATILKATITPSSSTASVRVNQDGSVHVLTSSVDLGQGLKTALAQIAAEAMSVPMERVTVSTPDTDTTPYDQQTSSSRSTFSMGNAVVRAAEDAKKKLVALAASELQTPRQELFVQDGGISAVGDSGTRVSFGDLLHSGGCPEILGWGSFVTEGGLDPATGKGVSSVHWHQGAAGCQVEVDLETGKVAVLSMASSVFAGRVVNPTLAQLQVEGSVLFGVGHALFEKLEFDDGRLTNGNLSDYQIPSFRDTPKLTTILAEGGEEMHGVGEMALPPVSPALSNALFDAIGVRIYETPITPESVLRALEEPRSNSQPEQRSEETATA